MTDDRDDDRYDDRPRDRGRDPDDRDDRDWDGRDRPRRRRPRPRAGSNRPVWIALGAVGCLVLAGCAGLIGLFGFWGFKAVTADLPAATAAADGFLDRLKQGKVDEAYQATTARFRAGQTPDQFAAFVARHETLTRHTTRTTNHFGLFQGPGGKQARLQTTLQAPNNATTCTVVLAEEDGAWKVDQFTVP
ncbi:MAG: hypothetical protein K2X82_12425 [Gemmataceae bacterium]|nr:hypothetical protein [Gemmataceae bacterium]